MTKVKSANRIIEIKPEFESVLVCNDKHLRPFIEILIQEPENITNQKLGTLIGVLEVADNSEDSSYIVNYLISIIKKEYFAKPKRGPIESLESALHKANLALSGLAEHGNINWLGKLNALIAVTEKNNLHLSQAGNANAFLLRSKVLTNISAGLAPAETDPNPLKTFVSVSSGRLEKDDKLIIATAEMFDVFSLEEIKKSALRFSNPDFVQFLRTALGSELQKSAVLIADLISQAKIIPQVPKKSDKEKNVFSSQAFAGTNDSPVKQKDVADEIKKEIQAGMQEFTDEKTGHIYIKEDYGASIDSNYHPAYFKILFEKTTNWFKENAQVLILFWHKLKKISLPTIKNTSQPQATSASSLRLQVPKISQKIVVYLSNFFAITKDNFIKIAKIAWLQSSRLVKYVFTNAGNFSHAIFSPKNKSKAVQISSSTYNKFTSFFPSLFPNLKKIQRNAQAMNYQQKIYTLLILVLIFIVPLVGIRIKNSFDQKMPVAIPLENQTPVLPLEQDRSVTRVESLNSIYSGDRIIKVLNLNTQNFIVTATEIFDLEKNQSFSMPTDFGTPIHATGMQDLNLLFLINSQNKIISFSPISGVFQNNNLAVPSGANIRAIGTYLTYIYLADSTGNQIYRHPRAEGGFGAPLDWLKDSIDLSNTVDMAIGDNIFLANKNNIIKLFRGKNQDFSIEQTETPLNITAIAHSKQADTLFILDAQNARVIQLNSAGRIVAQYYNPELSSAISITADANAENIYIAMENSIRAIPLN